MHLKPRALFVGSAVLGGLVAVGCSSATGGESPSGGGGFQLLSISVFPNDVWEINRPIEFEFSEAVDFLTVSSNTINITTLRGLPATGNFSFKAVDDDGDGIPETVDESIIVFQPNCPLMPDYSDAGFQPTETYVITVVGRTSGTDNTIKASSDDRSLDITQRRTFFTPDSIDRSIVFLDGAFGPPEPVIRPKDAMVEVTEGVTYVEIGANTSPDSRIFFEFDAGAQKYSTKSGAAAPDDAPLNLYSEPGSQVAMVLEFNQPVDPSALNVSDALLHFEFMDALGAWQSLDTRVELVENCTVAGARVRLEAIGVLPAGSSVRAVIETGFLDITGADFTPIKRVDFAVVDTEELAYASLPAKPADGADEYLEEFDFAPGPTSLQDVDALFATPMANWSGGTLTAAFDFKGTGGQPGGDHDWVIEEGEVFLFDTDGTTFMVDSGGTMIPVSSTGGGGVVDIRNLTIEMGGELRVQGSNALEINASGTVRIDGQLTLNGLDAPDVIILNAGNIPAPGGQGAAGGGDGGTGSGAVNTSSIRGSRGRGPFGDGPTGGWGGESGFAPESLGKDARRPGGGGGGRFAADASSTIQGLFAGSGKNGPNASTSAVTISKPARGGKPGDGPFIDGAVDNDFFGAKPVVVEIGPGDFDLLDLIRGELTRLWAGYGGGGGGDALPATQYPTPGWTAASDERGGGGGGGGGALRVRALGPIIFGPVGQIHADGGLGATGENTLLQDHVGGTGGSGTGGHVMLESATRVDFANGDAASAPFPVSPHITVRGGPERTGPLTNPPIPTGVSYGGSGGPGVIQLHVPRVNTYSDDESLSDIILPSLVISGGTTNKLDDVSLPAAIHLVATFGAKSAARSKWISIGGADQDPSAGVDRLQFLFGGIETAGPDAGKIMTTVEQTVTDLPAVLGPELLSSFSIFLLDDDITLFISGVSLNPIVDTDSDIYLRTPALLKNFVLRIEESSMPTTFKDFAVASATFDDGIKRLILVTGDPIDGTTITLGDYQGLLIAPAYRLIPRFFQVSTNGVVNSLLESANVTISFEGAMDDGFGMPDKDNILVPLTSDIADFNSMALPLGDLHYFRIQVEFDLGAPTAMEPMGAALTPDTKPVVLDFLRLPFRF